MTSRSPNPFTRDATVNSRALHWVLKIGNLKKSIDFFEQVIGLRVLRHEEFSSGCEATCNGPYGGAWSKTMVGFGDEKDNFVLELTYNYGSRKIANIMSLTDSDLHFYYQELMVINSEMIFSL